MTSESGGRPLDQVAPEQPAHRILRHEAHAIHEHLAAAGHADGKPRLRIGVVRLERGGERAPAPVPAAVRRQGVIAHDCRGAGNRVAIRGVSPKQGMQQAIAGNGIDLTHLTCVITDTLNPVYDIFSSHAAHIPFFD